MLSLSVFYVFIHGCAALSATQPNHSMWEKAMISQWQNSWRNIRFPQREEPNRKTINVTTKAYLGRSSPEACMGAVKDLSYSLCFASGGLNPKKPGDTDHYTDDAWTLFPQGGDYYSELNAIGCQYCPSIGYWPAEEQSMMIYCPWAADAVRQNLAKHCIETGIDLYQDAVLYRGDETETVFVLKTYPEPSNHDIDYLKSETFGAPMDSDGTFGTKFDAEGEDNDALFVFAMDEDKTGFCNTCYKFSKFSSTFCIPPGTGLGGAGGMCDEVCTPCQGEDNMQKPYCCPK